MHLASSVPQVLIDALTGQVVFASRAPVVLRASKRVTHPRHRPCRATGGQGDTARHQVRNGVTLQLTLPLIPAILRPRIAARLLSTPIGLTNTFRIDW